MSHWQISRLSLFNSFASAGPQHATQRDSTQRRVRRAGEAGEAVSAGPVQRANLVAIRVAQVSQVEPAYGTGDARPA